MVKRNLSIRRFAKRDLGRFVQWVQPQITGADLNLAMITDTHDRTQPGGNYYGPNGFWHVQEQHWLAGELPIDWRVHLGDVIDGSEPSVLSLWRLKNIMRDYRASHIPFVVAKGNHDDNDKYAEKNPRFSGSFHPWVFNEVVYRPMAAQMHGLTVTAHGLSVFDHNGIRVITVNTSDVPVRWFNGRKNYDMKKTLAVTAAQMQELAAALEGAGNRDVLIMSHAPAMTRSGKPGLRYNGRQFHELLWAFNQKLRGHVNFAPHPDFGGSVNFDFTNTTGTIIAAVAGHWHTEEDFTVNGVHYNLNNVSAVMGKRKANTTRFNRRLDRRIGTPSEYAGYVLSVDVKARRFNVYGYGAASAVRRFSY